MDEYDQIVQNCAMQMPIETLVSHIQKWRAETDSFKITSVLRGLARNAPEQLDDKAREDFESLGRAARSNRLTRSFEDNLGRLWGLLLGRQGSSTNALKGMIEELAFNVGTIDALVEVVTTSLPRWFKKLPCITLFCSFSFAIFVEVYLRQQTLDDDNEEARRAYLEGMKDKERKEMIEGFKKSLDLIVTEFFTGGVSAFEQALPDRLHDLPDTGRVALSASLRFVTGMEDSLPVTFFQNPNVMGKVKRAWKGEHVTLQQETHLCRPPPVANGVLYSSVPETFMTAYDTLVPSGFTEFEGLRSNFLLCKELAKDGEDFKNNVYKYHGRTNKRKKLDVREVRLQTELYNFWNHVFSCGRETTEKICDNEGLRAQLHRNNISRFWKSVQSRASIIKDNLRELFTAFWILCIIADDNAETFCKVCSYFLNI